MGIPDDDVLAKILLELKAIHSTLKKQRKEGRVNKTIYPPYLQNPTVNAPGTDLLNPEEMGDFFHPFNQDE